MSELKTKLEEIKRQKDTYILPENLKKDVTVYGVTGTLESGSGDVKLFDTIEHMQQDENPQEGDLAVVYREEIQAVTEESEFSSCIFPNTVVLEEVFSDNVYGRFRSTGSGFFDGMVDMSSSNFRFDGYGESSEIRIQYESQDGITYTRTDGGNELQEFGTTIQWDDGMGSFNSVVGNFMKIGGNYFDGLYEYKQKGQYGIPYNFRIENNTLLYDIIPFDVPSFAKSIGVNTKSGTLVVMKRDENGDFIGYYSNNSSGQSIVKYNGRLYYANSYGANCSYTDLSTGETTSLTNGQQVTVGSITTYIMLDTEMEDNDKLVYFIPSGNWEYNVYIDTYTLLQPSGGFRYQSYYFADTQLDATADYVYEKTFYGKNGVEDGTLGNSISTNFNDIVAGLYAKALISYENTPTKILASKNEIDKNIYIIPTKINGTSLLDFSQLTDTGAMFYDAINFIGTEVFDIQSSTHCGNMFRGCKNLKILPIQLSTTNVTAMNGTFYDCINLTFIPNMNTSNVTTMWGICCNCINLVTVPILNTSKVTVMENMFTNCSSLSNESLNNILYMCANANAYINQGTNMTLQYIGLTQEQATICTTLSNYQAFTNAGWTTGY